MGKILKLNTLLPILNFFSLKIDNVTPCNQRLDVTP